MTVNKDHVQRHIQDYCEATGAATTRFVCPITLEKCDESDLIEGHILNQAFEHASRKKVLQYGRVDNFYGATVEPSTVAFLNSVNKNSFLKFHKPQKATFADGTSMRTFIVAKKKAKNVARRFTRLNNDDGESAAIFAEISADDPRLERPYDVEFAFRSYPAHWTASMMKAGHLCLFEMLGYRAIVSPMGNAVRHTLATFYKNGGSDDAAIHFSEFKNAVKVIASRVNEGQRLEPYGFDTLEDREFLVHQTTEGCTFAATCIFRINNITTTVTLPEALDKADPGYVWKQYACFMNDPLDFQQTVRRARFKGSHWEIEDIKREFRWITDFPL